MYEDLSELHYCKKIDVFSLMELVLGLRRHWEPNGRPWAWLFELPLHCAKAQKAWLSPSFTRTCIYQDNSGYTYFTCCIFFECFLAKKTCFKLQASRPPGPNLPPPHRRTLPTRTFPWIVGGQYDCAVTKPCCTRQHKRRHQEVRCRIYDPRWGRWDGEWEGIRIFWRSFCYGW